MTTIVQINTRNYLPVDSCDAIVDAHNHYSEVVDWKPERCGDSPFSESE